MADYDFEMLQIMQKIYYDVVEQASTASSLMPPSSVRDTIAKSLFAITGYGQQDIHKIERYALAKAMTALAGMTP